MISLQPTDSSKSVFLDPQQGSSRSDFNTEMENNGSTLDVTTTSINSQNKKMKKTKSSRRPALYTLFNPTYKSKSEDFKKIFATLPPEERLIVGESPDSSGSLK